VLPPIAVGGPYVEIRRLGRPAVPGESLVSQGVLSADMLQTLRSAVAVRRNVVILGPSDAGVSSLVGVLTSAIHADERIAIFEASPEVALPTGRAIRLVGGAGGLGAVLRRAAAIRADRLVVDGVTGHELRAALVLLSGRSGGGILGIRAYAPGPTLEQLEALAALGGSRDGLTALVGSVEGLVELFEHGESGFASTGTRPSFS
jgi:Flp pilus assembly CpaF family ATPase